MQTVYRARCLADARSACSALADAGVATHIADQELWEIAGQRKDADVIRVLVDNRALDKARRTIRAWEQTRPDLIASATAHNDFGSHA